MLPAPAKDTAKAFNAKVRRLADTPRSRRLDNLEKLWKGKAYADRPSFWDPDYPLAEKAPCVQSSLAEAAGRRLTSLVFGNARFPALSVGESAWGVSFSDGERKALAALVKQCVEAAKLRPCMRAKFTQGQMVGTSVLVASVERGRLKARLFAAKWCEPEFSDDGETLTALELRYRHDVPDPATGEAKTHWFRRRIDASTDTTWDVEAREDGYEPEWGAGTSVAHGLGFVPVLWHRNDPDVSDCDPVDGSPLFDGLEAEIEALDMAMSQHHRNGRVNGDPQTVVIGADAPAPGAPSMGEQGRTADPGKGSLFSQVYDAAGKWLRPGGKAALKKSPNTIWRLKEGADAKQLETSGAGAAVLREDAAQLRRAILDARGIVMASPETISANASAALMRTIHEPMVAVADNCREEWGEVLCDAVNLLLRVALTTRQRGGFVALKGLDDCAPVLSRCLVPVQGAAGPVWVGLPLDLKWGEYWEPTWPEVTAAVAAATQANGGRAVLSLKQSVALVAPVLGVDDVDAQVDAIEGEDGAMQAAARETLAAVAGPAPRPAEEQPAPAPAEPQPATTEVEQVSPDVAMGTAPSDPTDPANAKDQDAALNGAQVESLLAIVEKVSQRLIPRETGVKLITAAFPIPLARADELMGEVGRSFFAASPEPPPFAGGAPPKPEDDGPEVAITEGGE